MSTTWVSIAGPDGPFASRARRDARYRELKAQGADVRRTSIRNQYLHPQYVTDAPNEDRTSNYWPVLYSIERARPKKDLR